MGHLLYKLYLFSATLDQKVTLEASTHAVTYVSDEGLYLLPFLCLAARMTVPYRPDIKLKVFVAVTDRAQFLAWRKKQKRAQKSRTHCK